ncbi:MAG: PadR family transcriptional regulator [Acidobacteria bacterium]|nr:PadR family transcriptional regulator [Acidobacteriota bacterium]
MAATAKSHSSISMLETQVLLVLASTKLHGYGIALEIQKRDPDGPKIYPTNLYRRLHDLADRGLIANSGTELDDKGRARKTFSITDGGREALASQTSRLAGFVDELRAAEGSPE